MSITSATDFTVRQIDCHVGVRGVIQIGLTYSGFIVFAALFALNEMAGLQPLKFIILPTFFTFIQEI